MLWLWGGSPATSRGLVVRRMLWWLAAAVVLLLCEPVFLSLSGPVAGTLVSFWSPFGSVGYVASLLLVASLFCASSFLRGLAVLLEDWVARNLGQDYPTVVPAILSFIAVVCQVGCAVVVLRFGYLAVSDAVQHTSVARMPIKISEEAADRQLYVSLHGPNSAALSPSGTLLAIPAHGTGRSAVFFAQAPGGRTRDDLTKWVRQGSFGGVAFSPDGERVAATIEWYGRASRGYSLVVWDLRHPDDRLFKVDLRGKCESLAFSPDGRTIATAEGFLVVRDAFNGVTYWTDEEEGLPSYGGFIRVVYSSDGRLTVGLTWTGKLVILDAVTGRRLHSAMLSDPGRASALAVGGELAAASVREPPAGKDVRVVFRGLGDFKGRQVRIGRRVSCLALTPAGDVLVAGCENGLLALYDTGSGAELRLVRAHPRTVCAAHFSADGQLLATADWSGLVVLWKRSDLLGQ